MRILLIFIFILLSHISLGGVRQASPDEIADRQFVLDLFNHQEYNIAGDEAEQYRVRYPKGVFFDEMLFLSGRIAQESGHFVQSAVYFSRLSKKYPHSPYLEEAEYYSAVAFLRQKKYAVAANKLSSFQQDYPTSKLDTWAYLGEARLGQKLYQPAIIAFQIALKTHPKDLQTQLNLAWALEWQGQIKKAHREFNRLLSANIAGGQKAKILYQLGRDHFEAQAYPAAYHAFKRQWSQFPQADLDQQSRFWSAQAVVFWGQKSGQGRIKEALQLLVQNQGADQPLQRFTSMRQQGLLLEWLGRPTKAEAVYGRLQVLDVQSGLDLDLSLHRAGLAAKRKDFTQAKLILIAAMGRTPGNPVRLETALWKLLLNLGDCGAILSRFQSHPVGSPVGWYAVGQCQAEQGNYGQASRSFGHLKPGGPWEAQAAVLYVEALEKQNQFQAALALVERSIKAKVQPELYFYTHKMRILRQGKDKNATSWGEKTLAQHRGLYGEGHYLFDLAQSYGADPKDPKRALELYRLAQKQVKTRVQKQAVLEKRRLLLLKIGDTQGLIHLYHEAISLASLTAAKRQLALEIAKLRFETGGPLPVLALKKLSKDSGQVGAEAFALLAEINIGKKAYPQAAKQLRQGIKKKINPLESNRLRFRLAQVLQASEHWQAALAEYKKVSGFKGPLRQPAKKQVQAIQNYLKGQ